MTSEPVLDLKGYSLRQDVQSYISTCMFEKMG